MSFVIHQGDALSVLRTMPEASVNCVVSSPPYWALRDYGTATWEGGDLDCKHKRENNWPDPKNPDCSSANGHGAKSQRLGADCKCGARRIDQQIGLEASPAEYVAKIVEIFREVRRVLRDDGTCWINLGDSYAGSWGAQSRGNKTGESKSTLEGTSMLSARQITAPPVRNPGRNPASFRRDRADCGGIRHKDGGLKPKDLIGIPWMVAKALQEPYHTGPIKCPEDRAWLAGMVDSDGCLGIRLQHPREGRGKNETFIPYLAISQSDTSGLERARAITGMGKVNVKERPSEDKRGIRSNRVFYTWRLDGQMASVVIRDIYPYLVIKQLQAQIVYAMNLSLKWGRPTRSLPVPQNVMLDRRKLYECIKALNQRKDVDLPPLPEVPPAEEPGWWLRSDIIWHKNNPMPESVSDRPTKAHEYIFLFSKSKRYFYDAAAIAEPASLESHARYARGRSNDHKWADGGPGNQSIAKSFEGMRDRTPAGWHQGTRPATPSGIRDHQVQAEKIVPGKPKQNPTPGVHPKAAKNGSGIKANESFSAAVKDTVDFRNKRSVWTISTMATPEAHFATFPIELPEICLKAGCPEDGVVLDPFAGAGTTGLACLKNNRRFVGIELSAPYIEMAYKRAEKYYPLLLGPRAVNSDIGEHSGEEAAQ